MNLVFPPLWSVRSRIFFWVGMAIFPLFWVWWTGLSRFTKTSRAIALAWTAVYVCLVVKDLPFMMDHYLAVAEGHTWILQKTFLGLGMLLALRINFVSGLFLFYIVSISSRPMSPSSWAIPEVSWFLCILLIGLGALHLLLDSLRGLYHRLERVKLCFACPKCRELSGHCTHPLSSWRPILRHEDP